MYERFLALRQQFDDQKRSLLKILWVYCGAYHPDLKEIPVIEDASKFIESEKQVGEFFIGDFLGQGQFAEVKSCMSAGSEKELAIKIIKACDDVSIARI